MTKKEFAQILSTVVEQKIVELFADPDEGLVIKEHLRKRLLCQKKAVAEGERGIALRDAVKRIGLRQRRVRDPLLEIPPSKNFKTSTRLLPKGS